MNDEVIVIYKGTLHEGQRFERGQVRRPVSAEIRRRFGVVLYQRLYFDAPRMELHILVVIQVMFHSQEDEICARCIRWKVARSGVVVGVECVTVEREWSHGREDAPVEPAQRRACSEINVK
jgi:hypothetical protein